MKKRLLREIQDTVIKYANIIASVINVEVEIVDSSLVRIAGTGIYKASIDKSLNENGYVYRKVLEEQETKILNSPKDELICCECKNRDNCCETKKICTPIIYNSEIIGVIGLICINEEQKDNLEQNLDNYILFINQIAEFISSKIYEYEQTKREHQTKELMEHIVDSVENGVLMIDTEDKIIYMNNSAKEQLNLKNSHIGKEIKIANSNGYSEGAEVFDIYIDKMMYSIYGEILPVHFNINPYDKIIIFNKINKKDKRPEDRIVLNQWGEIRLDSVIGKSVAMQNIKEKIRRIANSKSTVFITGDSGTGKEVVARAIHSESDRWDKPFIAINCGAIPETLLESELFGYVKGAFSGASSNGRVGKFELANEGVIFLDEIGDMSINLQVKLLRVLQERKFVRVGSNKIIDLDIRIIAATNKDIKQLISEKKFREDLYYRLNVIPIEIPSLKERKEDIEPLVLMFVDRYCESFGKNIYRIEDEAMQKLINYTWNGNIRELQNAIEFMINLVDHRGVVTSEMLPDSIINYYKENNCKEDIKLKVFEEEKLITLEELEKKYITYALNKYGYDTKGKKLAAEKLGIGLATLYRKFEK